MKKYTSLLVLLTTFLSFSQVELTQSDIRTNDKEYQFLTEEYELGHDLTTLEGYHFEPFKKISIKQFTYDFQFFVMDSTKDIKAILIKITKEKKNESKSITLCLPINNDKLFKKFTEKYENLGFSLADYFEQFVTSSIEMYISQFYNSNNQDIKTSEKEYEFLNTYVSRNSTVILEGYKLAPFYEVVVEEKYNYNYMLFVETATENVKAISIRLTKLKNREDKIRHLCIPFNNEELYQEYRKDEMKKLGVNLWYNLGVSKIALYSKIIDNLYNVK